MRKHVGTLSGWRHVLVPAKTRVKDIIISIGETPLTTAALAARIAQKTPAAQYETAMSFVCRGARVCHGSE